MALTTDKIMVVGTTFAKPRLSWFDLDGIKGKLEARIVPETSNKWDSNAKRVEVFADGKYRKVGYVKKDSVLYRQMKIYKKQAVRAIVSVRAYSKVGQYSDHYDVQITA